MRVSLFAHRVGLQLRKLGPGPANGLDVSPTGVTA
jgi:hypothetical protein